MSFLPGAGEFIAGPIDNRDHVIKELTKLIATNPKNIEDLWYYYKFIVRKIGLDRDENVIKEQNFYNDYDYMEKNPLMVGEGPLYDDSLSRIFIKFVKRSISSSNSATLVSSSISSSYSENVRFLESAKGRSKLGSSA